jgi:hypothetical protein
MRYFWREMKSEIRISKSEISSKFEYEIKKMLMACLKSSYFYYLHLFRAAELYFEFSA